MSSKRIIGTMAGMGAVLVLGAVGLRFVASDHPAAVHVPEVSKVSRTGAAPPGRSDTEQSAGQTQFSPMAPVQSQQPGHDARSLVSKWRAQAPDDKLLDLYEAIVAPSAPGAHKPQHDADLNGIMDRLCSSEPDSARLAEFFVEIMLDPRRDVVQRDYAIQHLRVVCRVLLDGNRFADGGSGPAAQMACDALMEVVPENTCCLAGTAILALAEIAGKTPAAAPGAVSRLAMDRARDTQAEDGIRVTALLVGARLQDPDALTVAWQILDTSDRSSLRLAAISVLAALGNQDTAERLGRMNAAADEMETKARDAAIRKISGRKT